MAKRLFRRSQYETALDHYRKARRRGDVVEAHRWLKLADMHLRVADRFDMGVHASMLRDSEREEARARAAKAQHDKEAASRPSTMTR